MTHRMSHSESHLNIEAMRQKGGIEKSEDNGEEWERKQLSPKELDQKVRNREEKKYCKGAIHNT